MKPQNSNNQKEILLKYFEGIASEVLRLKSLGCNDEHISKKIHQLYRDRSSCTLNTANFNLVLSYVLNKKIILKDGVLYFQ